MKVIFFIPVKRIGTCLLLSSINPLIFLSTFYFLLMIIPQMPVRVARVGGYRNICQAGTRVIDCLSPYKIAT